MPRAAWSLLGGVALVAVVTGVVMLTVAAPSADVGGRLNVTGIAVTAPGLAALTGDAVTVTVTGSGPVFVGLARQADADAWVGDAAAVVVTGLADTDTLTSTPRPGSPEVPDPTVADIWLDVTAGEGRAELVVARPAPDHALVVTGAGEAGLSWHRQVRHPAAWPLVAAGAVMTVIAARGLARRNARDRARRRALRVGPGAR